MSVRPTWSDEPDFFDADPRRRTSPVTDLGATWREAGSNDAWRLTWLRDTGELYRCRADSWDGSCSDVTVLALVRTEAELDALLHGWQDLRTEPDGLDRIAGLLNPLATAC